MTMARRGGIAGVMTIARRRERARARCEGRHPQRALGCLGQHREELEAFGFPPFSLAAADKFSWTGGFRVAA